MRSRLVALILPLMLQPAAPLPAQEPPAALALDSGRLVRLHLHDGTILRGRLLRAFTSDSGQLTFCPYPAPPCPRAGDSRIATLDADLVSAMEVQRGTRLWRGVAIGAGIGALLGGFVGWLENGLCDRVGCGTPTSLWVMSGAVQFGLWGALFGSQGVVWGPARFPSLPPDP